MINIIKEKMDNESYPQYLARCFITLIFFSIGFFIGFSGGLWILNKVF